MEGCIALFVSGKEGFFRERACINCSIDNYCACDGADVLFDVDSAMRKELVDVGQGVRMTEPIKVDKGLLTGWGVHASLSHQGILAIGINYETVQFTDLNNDRQAEIKVEAFSLVGFYDDMAILLTGYKPLREVTVEEVFNNPTIETFKEIEGTNDVILWTDVSLLHVRRVLYYPRRDCKLFSFNVDTRINTKIDLGMKVSYIASFTGIYCAVRAVFKDPFSRSCTCILNSDNTITKVNEG